MENKYNALNQRTLFSLAILICFTYVSSALGGEFAVFGPKTYIRETSGPKTVDDNFSVLNPNTDFTLRIINGDLEDSAVEKVSSSLIYLNGQKLIGPEKFNQNVNYLDIPANLINNNSISVEVRSKPGGRLTARIIGKDDIPPTIQIATPSNNSLLETKTTSAYIILTDDISGINPITFKALLNNQDITSSFTLPEYSLSSSTTTKTDLTLQEGENTLEVSIADFANNNITTISKFTVRTTPPILPTSGFIHGRVFDARTGLPLEKASVTTKGIRGTLYTDNQGRFSFPTPGTGEFELTIQKSGYTFAQRRVKVVSTRDSAVDPIYLMPLDTQTTTITSVGGVATNSIGTVEVNFPQGAIEAPIDLKITQYENSKELPRSLPQDTQFVYGVDFLPKDISFANPVTVRIKNIYGFQSGRTFGIGYYNRHTLQWEEIFINQQPVTATVSSDGQWLGFKVPHFCPFVVWAGEIFPARANIPYGIEGRPPAVISRANTINNLDAKDPGVSLRSGTLSISHNLPPFRTLGNLQSITLNYNSLLANPNAFIGSETFLYDTEYLSPWLGMAWGIPMWVSRVHSIIPQTITAKFEFEGKIKEIKLQGISGPATQRILEDGINARDNTLNTGSYPFKITLSNDYRPYFADLYMSNTGVLNPEPQPLKTEIIGRIIVNNQINSSFGAGWMLSSLQRLYFDPDGKILLNEGDVSSIIFDSSPSGAIIPFVNFPEGSKTISDIAFDNSGNLLVTVPMEHRIFKVTQGGIVTIIAGTGEAGYNGDGRSATTTQLNSPTGICVDSDGNIYIADYGNFRVRKIDTNGIISTVAGIGTETLFQGWFVPDAHPGDGGPAINAEVAPRDVEMDSLGNLYISDRIYGGSHIRKVDTNGIIKTLVSNHAVLFSGSNFTIDKQGNLYLADYSDHCIRKVDKNEKVSIIAGISEHGPGYSGDGGLAKSAEFSFPNDIIFDENGNLYISDSGNKCIRKIDTDGIIRTVSAIEASEIIQLDNPTALCLDKKTGNIFISQWVSDKSIIHKIDFPQTQLTVYKPLEGDYSRLIKNNQDNTYRRIMKDGVVHNFSNQGLLLSTVDRNGNTTTCNYDSEGKLISITDPVGQITYFDYDSSGHLMCITDPAGRTMQLLIDGYGDLVKIINSDGSIKSFTYNDKHLLISETDTRGFTTQYIYDEFGRVKEARFPQGEVIKFQSSDTQDLINNLPANVGTSDNPAPIVRPEEISAKVTDGNNNATAYFTNRFGSITKQTDVLGRATSIYRDVNSNPTKIVLANNISIPLEYDLQGNLTTFARQISWGVDFLLQINFIYEPKFNQITRISSPNGNTEITYDDKGNPNHIANTSYGSSINDINLTYDTRGLVKTITNALGKITQFNYDTKGNLISITDPLGNTVYLTYDLAGNVTFYKDALGRITQFAYDLMNRLTKVIDTNGAITRYQYDALGNLIKIIDTNLNETTFEYDSVNQLIKVTNSLGQSKVFNYDLNRNLTSIIDAKGQIINFQYDAANQLIKKILPDNIVNFVYDSNGRLIEASDSDSKLKFSYISISQLSQVDTGDSLNPVLKQPITSTKYYYYYFPPFGSYTPSGQLRKMTMPDNSTVDYGYDDFKRLNRITLTQPNLPSAYVAFSYDSLSRRFYDPTGKYHFYDDNNQLISLKDSYYATRYQYTYDAVGNRTSMADSTGTHTYTYDSLNRLLSATNPQEVYTYDSLGSRLSSLLIPTYTYDKCNRLLDDGQYTYTYDANGNLTSKIDKSNPANTTSYTYNLENQLIRIDYPDGTNSSYRYDALGRRIEKDVNGSIRRYVYDNEDIIAEYDGSNNLIATYLHGPGIDEPIMMERSGQRYYYLRDGLGSIVALTDSIGTPVQTYVYDTFGNIVTQTGSLENPYTYTGREYDSESGLYYYRSRYYSPGLGRFLQEDPLFDINLYSYVNNNPVNWVDPWGFSKDKPWWEKPWWYPTPAKILRWSGRILNEVELGSLGSTLSIAGIVIEPGGTGKITGIIVGGATGIAVTSFIPIPGARVVGAIVGGAIGGTVGSYFDSPAVGQPNYNEWEGYNGAW